MPDSVSEERRYLVSQYGAQVILVHDDGDIGACIARCMELAQEMAQKDPRVFIPQQFVNPDNPEVHRLLYRPGDLGGGGGAYRRLLFRRGHWRDHFRYRRSATGTESGDDHLGGRAGKCRHPFGRQRGHPSPDGHR